MSEKPKYSFKCLENECPQRVCCTREPVTVTLGDIVRWSEQDYLSHVVPGVVIQMPESESDALILVTARRRLKKDPSRTACVFYHEESNACSIRYARPISCRTFPLQFAGEKFVLSNKECSGIGKGEVARDALKEARDTAEQEFKERSETEKTLPGLYTVLMSLMLRQSAEAMKDLSDEDRKRIDEIMSHRSASEKSQDAESGD